MTSNPVYPKNKYLPKTINKCPPHYIVNVNISVEVTDDSFISIPWGQWPTLIYSLITSQIFSLYRVGYGVW